MLCITFNFKALAVFIDPTLIDPVGDGLAANELVTRHPLTPLREWFPSDRCPYLLRISDAERAWLLVTRRVEQAVIEALDVVEGALHPRSVCGWIVNPMDCSALARELGAMALVVRPDGTRWPLRFWDPRVTSHLARVLMRDQYAAMRPFLENWRSLDHEGRLVQAAVPASTNEEPSRTRVQVSQVVPL